MRADQLLVERGMAPTRSAAQRLIATGAVRWRAPAGWRVPAKAGEDLPSEAVGDLSFSALALVLPALVPLMGGPLLLLVKPQFELQPVDIGPGGKVKDASAYGHVEKKLKKACATHGLIVRDWFDSATPGSEGA